jgi:ADP-dependent NAD(P)H-hydrate dehydratase / NAD(P)H-hydrate epimerase
MKILTAAEMREVDRRTIELGMPSLVLMENAGHRVVEFLERQFAPLASQRIAILCGKGNNGGDGLVVARQLATRLRPRALHVMLACPPGELKGDALENYRMLWMCGVEPVSDIPPAARHATIVLDALLGTGLKGAPTGRMLDWIREINTGFPLAKIVAVDIPSGVDSDHGESPGETVRADCTVTFTAPKFGQIFAPNSALAGTLEIGPIGSPPALYEDDAALFLSLVEPAWFAPLFRPRAPWAHKGDFGHVLVVAGSRGKTGAAAMSGMAALRSGAGLVTVATAASALPSVASFSPELMTDPLPETDAGGISVDGFRALDKLAQNKDVLAVGPGLGGDPETVDLVRRIWSEFPHPMVIDADGLNALAGMEFWGAGRVRVLTPHPGEMARLTGKSVRDVEADRAAVARAFARERQVTLVLKGYRTLIAFPDGRVWVNPTGSPAMATGGTGDILTGLTAGLLAQFPGEPDKAVAAAVWLHGMAGQLGSAELGEKTLVATDLLRFLPAAINACVSH